MNRATRLRKVVISTAVAVVLVMGGASAAPAPGSLDRSYGHNGVRLTSAPDSPGSAT